MKLEQRIKDLAPNHHLPLVDMSRSLFNFYSTILNEACPTLKCFAVRIRDDKYQVSPYELLPAKGSSTLYIN
jgi:hypothetical protein